LTRKLLEQLTTANLAVQYDSQSETSFVFDIDHNQSVLFIPFGDSLGVRICIRAGLMGLGRSVLTSCFKQAMAGLSLSLTKLDLQRYVASQGCSMYAGLCHFSK
jgi:hypothetical protein